MTVKGSKTGSTDPVRPGAEQWVPEDADLTQLRAAAPACRGCELWEPATQVVFSTGSGQAKVVLVGEQPGDLEDREGVPFVGPAGRLLHRAMDEAGLPQRSAYLTNAVKHFRFTQRGKRRIHEKPDLGHLGACKPWLDAELAQVDPALVVAMGATAARAVLGPGIKVTQQRGEILLRETPRGERQFLVTVHPSSILRARDDREAAYQALVADLAVAAGAIQA
ncbi:MAG: UdgX family uracil-DNA binding protein [Actinomycetota bacterium]|nr:UdgX family uracil-DNA binding protein [Actinomycetota bacterium]